MKTCLLAGYTGFILLCGCGGPAKPNAVAAVVKNQPADSISLSHADSATGTYVFAPKVDNSRYPEDYKDDTPRGELTITQGVPGEINFTIEYTSGYPDYGSVQLEGTAKSNDGGKTYVYDVLMEDYGGDDQEHCYILFKMTAKGIDVDNHNTLACGGGEHSNFEGLYLRQAKTDAQ